jgi:hypothetical protein
MKKLILPIFLICSFKTFAYEIPEFEGSYYATYQKTLIENNNNRDVAIANLEKTVAYQQRAYEEKINYLEVELLKYQNRLVEKSLTEEKIFNNVKSQYEEEVNNLKKELAQRTRSALELQRQVEKMQPSEDLKKVIQLNNELAADLRKSEGQLAAIQLEFKKSNDLPKSSGFNRAPASVESDK